MMVIIATEEGELLVMEVTRNETISDLKRRLQQSLNIPIDSQSLQILGWELCDDLDMTYYPIITDATQIDLVLNKFQITLKFSSKRIPLIVHRSQTIRTLKEKIQRMSGARNQRISLFLDGGMELRDELRELGDYGVCRFTEISVVAMLEIMIEFLNGGCISISVEETRTVGEMKEVVLKSRVLGSGVEDDEYLFVYGQRIMRKDRSLRWHGVKNGDGLYMFKGSLTQGEL